MKDFSPMEEFLLCVQVGEQSFVTSFIMEVD